MCTSPAYAWLLGCFRGMPPACAEQEMDGIMRQARDDHAHVCSRASGLGAAGPLCMLTQADVLGCFACLTCSITPTYLA
jgi:hypothetical protein